MQEPVASALAAWESFYVIVGSSSAALTGLMFVVISLGVERRHPQTAHAVAAFGTPTVVHFSAVFLVSAILSAPWRGVETPLALMGTMGVLGTIYVLIVARRAVRQSAYKPVLEDWLWHMIFPFVAYVTLAIAGLVLGSRSEASLFMVAGVTLILILCGIHNSWDSVTWNALAKVAGRNPGR